MLFIEQSLIPSHTADHASMSSDPLAEFRRVISVRARQFPRQWEASKKLLEETTFSSTITRLGDAVRGKDLPASVKERLLRLFEEHEPRRVQDLDGEALKSVTGFPPAKALRALAVFF